MSAVIVDQGTFARPYDGSSVVICPSFWRSGPSEPPSDLRSIAEFGAWFSGPAEIRMTRSASEATARNARLVLQARRMDLTEAMVGVTAIIASLRGACTIDAICALIGEHVGYGFFAIIRMIDDGSLRCVTPGLFTGATLVEPVARC